MTVNSNNTSQVIGNHCLKAQQITNSTKQNLPQIYHITFLGIHRRSAIYQKRQLQRQKTSNRNISKRHWTWDMVLFQPQKLHFQKHFFFMFRPSISISQLFMEIECGNEIWSLYGPLVPRIGQKMFHKFSKLHDN